MGDPAAPGEPDIFDEHPELLAALSGIADLDEQPLAEHHERLTRVHEVLQRALDDPPAAG